MTEDESQLDRLADAVEAYIERQSSGEAAPMEEFLDRHDEVRDLLEPMLDDRPGDPILGRPDGRRLGDYELVREIGRGGMGVVYEAVETSLKRPVALKVLAAHLTLSGRQIERFRREAAAAAKLVHPAIVPIYAVGEHEGTHYIAMEMIEGRNLRDLVRDVRDRCDADTSRLGGGDLGTGGAGYFDQVAEIVAQVADALAFSHAQEIVHRDIKPHNVLVTHAGRVCVVDFGLAKDLEADTMSITGEFAGTPQYVSPEQATPGEHVDGRSDVFSLGVILYELLTLRMPFDGNTTREVLDAVIRHEPRSIRARSPRVPRDLETICLKALEKDRKTRYSAAEMVEDLRHFLRREPIEARPVGRLTRTLRLAKRQKAVTSAVVLAFLLVVVAPLAFGLYYKAARDRLADEQARTVVQRDLARANQRAAAAALEKLFFRVSQYDLEYLPYTEEFRRQLMEDARAFYARLLEVNVDDPTLRFESARARGGLARIDLQQGNVDEAIRGLGSSIQELKAIAELPGASPNQVMDLANMYQIRAEAYMDAGVFDEVPGDLDRAREVLSRLPEDELSGKHSKDLRLRRARVYSSQVRYSTAVEVSFQAVEDAERAIELWSELVADYPDELNYLGQLAHIRITCGGMLQHRGRPDEAKECFAKALRELDDLLEVSQDNPIHREWRARALRGLHDVARDAGAFADADEFNRQAGEEYDALIEDYPSTIRFRRHRLNLEAARRIGLLGAGRVAEAAPGAAELISEARELCKLPSAGRDDRFNLAQVLMANAMIEHQRTVRDFPLISDLFEEAIEIMRELASLSEQLDFYATELAGFLSNRAYWWLLKPSADPRSALVLLEEAIAIQEGVVERGSVARARVYLAVHYKLLAMAGSALADVPLIERAATRLFELGAHSPAQRLLAARTLCTGLPHISDETEEELVKNRICAWLGAIFAADHTLTPQMISADPSFTPLREFPPFVKLLSEQEPR